MFAVVDGARNVISHSKLQLFNKTSKERSVKRVSNEYAPKLQRIMFQLCVVATFVSQQNIAKWNCHYEAAPTQYTQTQSEEMESIAEVRQNTCCGQCLFEWNKSLRLIAIRKMDFRFYCNWKLFKKGKNMKDIRKNRRNLRKIWEKTAFSVTKIQSVFHIYVWNILLLAIKSASFFQHIIFFMILVNFRSILAIILKNQHFS